MQKLRIYLQTFYSSLLSLLGGYIKKPKIINTPVPIIKAILIHIGNLINMSEPKAAPKTIKDAFIKVLLSILRLPFVKIIFPILLLVKRISKFHIDVNRNIYVGEMGFEWNRGDGNTSVATPGMYTPGQHNKSKCSIN